MWTFECDSCEREIEGISTTCKYCSAPTDRGNSQIRKSNFQNHAARSSFLGREYTKLPKASLLKQIGRRAARNIKKLK